MAIRWYGLVAPEEAPTGDRRMFAAMSLTYRDFPLPAAWQRVSGSGHNGSVVVASWDRQFTGDGGIWGSGEFLDPAVVPEVIEAMYLLKKGLIGPSVDLDPDLTYEIIDHPTQLGESAFKVTNATVHGLTFVMGPAFPQVHITVTDDDEMAILASAGIEATFAVNKSTWRSWPIATRETTWNFEQAVARIAQWSGGDPRKYAQAFLYQDKNGDPRNRESYRLPIADVANDKLILVPRGVMSAANFMSAGHGGLEQIPDSDRTAIQEVITEIYDVLREQYGDPRFIAPWQRGGRAGATSADAPPEASMEPETFTLELEEFAVRTSGWSSLPTSTGEWDEGRARRALDEWAGDDMGKYGRAFLWSDGSGNKTGFKFPIAMPVDGELTIFIRAVNNAKARLNQADIPAADKTRIEGILNSIQKRYSPEHAMGDEDEPCPEGQHRMPDGSCMDGEEMTDYQSRLGGPLEDYWVRGEGAAKIRWGTPGSFDRCVRALRSKFPQNTEGLCANLHHEATGKWPAEGKDRDKNSLTAAGVLYPKAAWFDDPKLTKPTPLTVTDDGRVFGHLAPWRLCHLAVGNRCQMAPKSATGYSFFHVGSVKTDDGRLIPTGKITLGTGHADASYGVRPATEHYDNTGTCVAVVRAGEDAHGIWVAGSLVADVSEHRVAELRRSPLSGDWRRVNGNLELVAALAVNDPGFPVTHNDADGAYSLVAAGVFVDHEAHSTDLGVNVFAQVDEFLELTARQERRKVLESIYDDMLPGEEGCACNV